MRIVDHAACAAMLALAALLTPPPALADPPRRPPPPAALAEGSRGWTFARLAEADALLRSGRPRAAARAFQDVFAYTEGTEWGTLAELGLAWSVATSGDVELGRALAADAHAAAGPAAETTRVVLALLSARAGDAAAALALLEQAPAGTDPRRADVRALARAYARFWAGDVAGAAAAFDAVAARPNAESLVDDARYGAAWSRFKAGNRDRAIADLAELVADAPSGYRFQPVPRRLVELDARAILGDGTRRYRRGERVAPEAQLARLLDADGFSRARAALRLLDPARLGRPLEVHRAADAPAAPFVEVATSAAAARPAPRPETFAAATAPDTARHDLLRVLLGLLVLALLAVLGWSLTRRTA